MLTPSNSSSLLIRALRQTKLNVDFIFRSVKAMPFRQIFRPYFGAKGWRALPVWLKPKCLASPVALRGNQFDYQVFAKVFIWGGYKNIVDSNTRFIIDAGANIGLSTAFFARMAPNAIIVGIEPEGGNFEILRQNTRCFGPRVRCINKALTSSGRCMNLDASKGRPDGYRFYEDENGQTESITIEALLDHEGWNGEVDLLKVDIEGGEYDLLLHPNLAWLRRVKRLVCEIHEHPRKKKLEERILSQGFVIEKRGEDTHFSRR